MTPNEERTCPTGISTDAMLGTLALSDEFSAAKDRVQGLPNPPSDRELLELYGLYEQATES